MPSWPSDSRSVSSAGEKTSSGGLAISWAMRRAARAYAATGFLVRSRSFTMAALYARGGHPVAWFGSREPPAGLGARDLDARARHLRGLLLRRPREIRPGPVMHGQHPRNTQKLRRLGRLARAHRVVPADGQQGDVRLVQLADQLHVAEH